MIVFKEKVIVRGIRPEENIWGPYQFPRPYKCGKNIYVSVHIHNDDLHNYGASCRWFKSSDKGETWHETNEMEAEKCGILLSNGDILKFPPQSNMKLDGYICEKMNKNTPIYNFEKRSVEGVLPLPDGFTVWDGGFKIMAYKSGRLPESIDKSEWEAIRISKTGERIKETVPVKWNMITQNIYVERDRKNMYLKKHFPRGNLKIGSDGALWVTAFSGEGHINPENGQYSPYYSAELFRSIDNGHSFEEVAHMEYPADGIDYPYQSGGFSDSDIEFTKDGRIVWFMRSAWAITTGFEWAPMYMTYSDNMGKTWSRPKKFSDTGILPRLTKCGDKLILVYARPGMFLCESNDGINWSKPLELMTPKDRSGYANVKITDPNFYEWTGSCCNPEIIALDDKSALVFYTDFYYPDTDGIKRKTVLCRKVTIED